MNQIKTNQQNFQKSVNARLDKCSFFAVTESEFTNDILPNENPDSKNIYLVTTSSGVQLWKGSVRIQFGSGGVTFTCGVVYIARLN